METESKSTQWLDPARGSDLRDGLLALGRLDGSGTTGPGCWSIG
jgi:hypothetical protein